MSGADGTLIMLSSCEYFNIKDKKWYNISDLPVPLLSSTALNYKNDLYILGGLTTNSKRSNSIYRYDKHQDKWIELNFHFPFGI